MGSLTKARPSGEDRGKSGRRTWYELGITGESSLYSAEARAQDLGKMMMNTEVSAQDKAEDRMDLKEGDTRHGGGGQTGSALVW